MALFEYQGFDKSGGRVQGYTEADNESLARQQLRIQGILLKKLAIKQELSSKVLFSSGKVSLIDIEFFTAELALLLDAGLKIDKGIELLKATNKKPAFNQLLEKITKSLRSGKQLSEALAALPDVFDPLYINLVSIGEATGRLADVFAELAKDLAFRRDLQQRISQALTYPMVILFVCLSSILFIFNYVVPNMASLFTEDMDLPFYTVFLLSSSIWLKKYQFILFGSLFVGTFACYSARKNQTLQQMWQKLSLKLPLVGSAVILVERIRLNRALAMMLKADVAIDNALTLASGNIKHLAIRQEVVVAINKVKRGELLSSSLRQTRLYPDLYASLLAVGEESGQLSKIFEEIANRSQRAFSNWVTRMTSLMEPLLILIMGGIVGSVVVVMMLSITSVTDVGI